MITAAMVNELRRATGSAMMDCKKALTESNGDMEKAIQILREKGQAKAAKRSGNTTSEGCIFCKVSEDHKTASMLELACETEPVAKNGMFLEFGEKISGLLFADKIAEIESEATTAELTDIRVKIGENVTISNKERFVGDLVNFYVHSNKKVGVLIEIALEDGSKSSDERLLELSKNLTLQIASLSPKSVSSDDLDPAFLKSELEIIKAQLKDDPKNKNKPEEILEKIVDGRKSKIFADVCLLEQEYVKEKIMIKELIESVAKEVGTKVSVKRFVRFAIGQ